MRHSRAPIRAAPALGSVRRFASRPMPLIDPAKLATLGKRGANPRLQKAVAILEQARLDGFTVAFVASNAVAMVYTNAIEER